MKVAIYVAIAEGGVIGSGGGMPWRLSTDLKRFKAATMGKPVVMGRKTWDSFPKRPLPGRTNIVITRNPKFAAEGAEVVGSLADAMTLARVRARCAPGVDEICILGGGEIYRQAMPIADTLHVTHVLAKVEGDTLFPPIDANSWEVVSSEEFPAGENDTYPTRYTVYVRKGDAG